MQNENRNEEAVSPVIATILMVAITVVLAGVLYVWASSLAEGNTDGNLTLYAFSASDAGATVSTGTDDALVMIAMDQGSDINWAAVSVKLTIDGNAPVTCDNPGVDGTSVCSLVEFGNTDDQVWSVGDGVTVVENGQDICSGSCSIDVTITDTREGKTIDTTNGVVAE
ncbi:MAG: archaellin/type IV pilin N-terminal domain-containing protein [Poseidonia sp.]